jgi:hypothetical protein
MSLADDTEVLGVLSDAALCEGKKDHEIRKWQACIPRRSNKPTFSLALGYNSLSTASKRRPWTVSKAYGHQKVLKSSRKE